MVNSACGRWPSPHYCFRAHIDIQVRFKNLGVRVVGGIKGNDFERVMEMERR